MSAVIKVENLSKQYRLGDVGTGTLRDDFKRWTHRIMGKEDPFLKIGEENDRSKKGESDYVWALKDINFEVEQGDVVGIIGRNGAGKSTLLKILSRTTAPTTGSVRVKGRIASLLEVGTGFHGELSGRENIYLNGAIMGLRKWEIDKKLDEIIDFAGVDKYLDTPVKRYSSGMYVRLAFAVAAHLEPDILIVDEVLAVGDAEFQKKCLGKMKDVSQGQGRTVLFVSHNIAAILQLCNNAILLENGILKLNDSVDVCIDNYQNQNQKKSEYQYNELKPIKVPTITLAKVLFKDETLFFEIHFKSTFSLERPVIGLVVYDYLGNPVFGLNNRFIEFDEEDTNVKSGKIDIIINQLSLVSGEYNVSFYLGNNHFDYSSLSNIIYFRVQDSKIDNTKVPDSKHIGSLLVKNTYCRIKRI